MKKLLFLLLALTVLRQLSVQAQPAPARWSIGLTAGAAFPVGRFANFQNPITLPVTVHPGLGAELSGTYRIFRSLSATLVVDGQQNRGDGLTYNPGHSGSYGPAGSYPDHYWKIARILGGAEYTIPLTPHAGPALLVRLLGGMEKVRSADYLGYLAPPTMPPNPVTNLISMPGLVLPWAFSYEADAGLQWLLHNGMAITGYAGYNGCRPSDGQLTISTSTIALRAGLIYYFHTEKRSR